jgi:arsenate reductase (thioredoxin)
MVAGADLGRFENLISARSLGCGDECPYVPGLKRADWPLPDPKGQGIEAVRTIRNDIEARIESLVEHQQLWAARPT